MCDNSAKNPLQAKKLAHMAAPGTDDCVYLFGEFTLDLAGGALLKAGAEVKLRPKSFAVLSHLVTRGGRLVSKEELLRAVWGHTSVTDGVLTQCLIDIRRALGDESRQMIRTVPRRGYLFDVPVSTVQDAENIAEMRAVRQASRNAPAESRAQGAHPIDSPPSGPSPPTAPRSLGGLRGRAIAAAIVALPLTAMLVFSAYLSMRPSDEEVRESFGGESEVKVLVLPFASLSPDAEERGFSAGLTDELIVRLQRLSGVRVIGRTTAFALQDTRRNASELAGDFGVQYVLEGSVGRDGNRLRVRGQLSDASGFSVWAETYNRPVGSIFEIQDQIVSAIAAELGGALRLDQVPAGASTTSIEAYQLYLQAKLLGATTVPSRESQARRSAMLDRALELDKGFAEAWVQKSLMHSGIQNSLSSDREAELAAAEEAAERAIAFAPDQGGGYDARALVRGIRGDWLGAERDSEQARLLRQDDSGNWGLYLGAGFLEKARVGILKSLDSDPLNANAFGFLMLTQEMLKDREAADATFERGRMLFEPWFGSAAMNWILLGRRDVEPIIEDPSRLGPPFRRFAELIDDRYLALEALNSAVLEEGYQDPVALANLAIWSAFFGNEELALRLLDEALVNRALTYMMWLPVFDEVRRLPEFNQLLIKLGLMDYWRATGWPDVCRPVGLDDVNCD